MTIPRLHPVTGTALASFPERRFPCAPAREARYTDAVQAALSVYNKHATDVVVQPRIAGSAPFYLFTELLGLPLVPAGMGFGSGAHAPNEIMLIEPAEGVEVAGLADIEKAYVDFIFALAE